MGNAFLPWNDILHRVQTQIKDQEVFRNDKDAKNAYVQAAAAVLRAKDCVMDTVTTVQENAEDVLAEAKEVNEKRQEEEIYSGETEEQEDEKCE